MKRRRAAVHFLQALPVLENALLSQQPPCRAADSVTHKTLPFPPAVCSIFRWSTVICRISAFSSLADPWERREGTERFRHKQRGYRGLRLPPGKGWGSTEGRWALPASQRRWAPASSARTGCCWCGRGGVSRWSRAESGGQRGRAGLRGAAAGRRALTPRRLFLAKICEVVEGDMEPAAELRFLRGAARQRSPRGNRGAGAPRGGGDGGREGGRGRGAHPAWAHPFSSALSFSTSTASSSSSLSDEL